MDKKIYSVKDLRESSHAPEKDIKDLIKRLDYGTNIEDHLFFTEDEFSEMLIILKKNFQVKKQRILEIIKYKQPIRIGKVRQIYERIYSEIPRITINSALIALSVDDCESNLWEDDKGYLYYGDIFYKEGIE